MINEKNLIEWCWTNLRFDNCPENWEDTYIIDILNGYQGTCYNFAGNIFTYADIRAEFTEDK